MKKFLHLIFVVLAAAVLSGCTSFPRVRSGDGQVLVTIHSPIDGGDCFVVGEFFPVSLAIQTPRDWVGPAGAIINFRISGYDGHTVNLLNIEQDMTFSLSLEDPTATGSIKIVFELPNGDVASFDMPEFPYFIKQRGSTPENKVFNI